MKCKGCGREFIPMHWRRIFCSKECALQYWNCWKRTNGEYKKKEAITSAKRAKKKRLEALNIVGRGILQCSNCGVKDVRLLEINHINGGGTKESKQRGGNISLYYDVINGKRPIEDLNILCKVCNQAHFIKLKYGIEYIISPKSN